MVRFSKDSKTKSPFKFNYKALFIMLLTVMGMGQQGMTQDTHYWTYQYGPRSTLLGGAVIGSALDLSGTYYNPGGLALVEDLETLLAATVFHYPSTTLKNVGQANLDFNSSGLGLAPDLVAAQLKFTWLKKHRLVLSLLTRHSVDFGMAARFIYSRDMMSAPGKETLIGDFQLNEKLSEPWLGITWAYKINENIGIGASQYVMLRTHEANFQGIIEALTPGGDLIMTIDSIEYKYENYRLLWKMGLALDFDRLTLGLTITTPSIKLYGRGTAGISRTFTGHDLDGDGIKDNWLAADYQEDLDSDYPTPISIGIGGTYRIHSTNIYLSAEWFNKIEKFDVLQTEDFESQSSGEIINFKVTHELESVLNYGIGVEHFFSQRFAAYASFATDFSAKMPGSDTNLTITDWDIYHLMGGTNLSIKKSQFTLGLGYSFGRRKIGQRLDPFEKDINEALVMQIADAKFTYSSIKFVVGFSF